MERVRRRAIRYNAPAEEEPVIYDIVTFDCYGTLIDWTAGITRAFEAAAAADGVDADASRLRALYEEIEHEVEADGALRYRDVLAETARRAASRVGWEMTGATAAEFAASVPRWPPFADTNAALERLVASGYRLGILSNVDDDLLAGTRKHFTVELALVVTAEQLKSYKPAHAHFLEARRRMGDARWLHAAQSYFHDVVPAAALGIDSAWINRNADAPSGDARPTREFRDLRELADWLAPLRDAAR